MSENDDTNIYFMPSLVSILLAKEEAKGTPLTEEEVTAIRDSAHCVALTHEQALKVEEERGYYDIDPERCWEEWQEFREALAEDE